MRQLQAARGASLSTPAPAADGASEPEGAPDDQPDGGTPVRRRTALLLAVAAAVLALDVVTKVLVVARLEGREAVELLGGQLLLQVTRNPGAAFSFLTSATYLFTTIAVVVVVVVLRLSRKVASSGWALALGLLLGGAAGNLVDRLLRSPGVGRGAVVDFIDFQVWPSFNVADSGIVVGGLLAVLLSARGRDLEGRPAGHA